MRFEFGTINNYKECAANVHAVKYNLNHDVNCKRGGFVVMRHNNVRGFEANLLNTIQNDVEIEPALQKNRMKE